MKALCLKEEESVMDVADREKRDMLYAAACGFGDDTIERRAMARRCQHAIDSKHPCRADDSADIMRVLYVIQYDEHGFIATIRLPWGTSEGRDMHGHALMDSMGWQDRLQLSLGDDMETPVLLSLSVGLGDGVERMMCAIFAFLYPYPMDVSVAIEKRLPHSMDAIEPWMFVDIFFH